MFCSSEEVTNIYLSFPIPRSVRFQTFRFPYQNLGFSLVGFTAFHTTCFQVVSSLWHFMTNTTITEVLGCLVAVRFLYYRLFFPCTRALQSSQIVRAWTFLYIAKNAAFVKILFLIFFSIYNLF